MVRETYNWFSHSSIRQKSYRRIYKLINSDADSPIKIPKSCPTRWLSVEKTINSILNMWLELKTHFSVVNDNHLETTLLREMYEDGKNFVYLKYLHSVLKEVQEVNLAFESRNADHVKLFDDLLRLLKCLTNKIIIPMDNFDYLDGDLDPFINTFLNFGYNFEKSCRDNNISQSDKKVIEKNLLHFVKNLIMEIRAKLPSNIQIFKKISLLSSQNVLSNNVISLLPIFEEFCNDTQEIEELENCLKNLKTCEWKNTERTDKFWIEVHSYKNAIGNNPFKKLSTFVLNILIYPYSNAEVERTFSVMNLFKNKIRNKMSLNTCNSLIHIKYSLKRDNLCCSTYEIPDQICVKINSNETYKKSQYHIESDLWNEEEDDQEVQIVFNNDQL